MSSSDLPLPPPQKGGGEGRDIPVLRNALILTSLFFVVEAIAGFVTNSLSLLSDAGHMLSDILALLVCLYAANMARRAPTAEKSYGYYRTEVLAALFNGLVLFLMIGFIYYEAMFRIFQPVAVSSAGVIAVGGAGLVVNLLSAWMLHGHDDLNVRGAYYHVIMDALSSLGALIAGILIYVTGWPVFDPLLSFLIGALVLFSAWSLIRDSINILMEAVPKHLNLTRIREEVKRLNGVQNIHDLHIWSIGSKEHAVSAHLVVNPGCDPIDVRTRVEDLLRRAFHLEHTTLQVEVQEDCIEPHE
ncbi:cation diffusion facilitator family transporter [bacterium]|nr:cation diffusion facilitator family transporter [bacterium]MCI0607097.1 cation diffusion facilitator family transporter [bacterium]